MTNNMALAYHKSPVYWSERINWILKILLCFMDNLIATIFSNFELMRHVKTNVMFFLFTVPVEATAFLAAVSAFAVFLLVIFIYVNKKWRILNVGIGGANGAVSKSSRSHGTQQKASTLPSTQSTDIRNDKLDGALQFSSPLCTSGNIIVCL